MTKFIRSMSRDLTYVRNKMDSNGYQFFDHCCKIMITNKPESIKGMIKELVGFCSWIQKITLSKDKKHIKKDLIMNNFFGIGDELSLFCSNLDLIYAELNNGEERKDTSKDEILFNNYQKFCDEVATHLENRQLNTITMNQLVNKYLII